jgi:hypothetical protein
MPESRTSKKGKRLDKRPARARYWATGRLCLRKVGNLIRSGMALDSALKMWESARTHRSGDRVPYEALRKLAARPRIQAKRDRLFAVRLARAVKEAKSR